MLDWDKDVEDLEELTPETGDYEEPVYDENLEAGEEPIQEEVESVPEYVPILVEENGTIKKITVPYSDLVDKYMKSKEYERLVQQQNTFITSVAPLLKTLEQSNVLQQILYYKSQGYSDDDIIKGLPQIWAQAQKENPSLPNFEEVEDKQQWIMAAINNQLKQILTPYEQELLRVKAELQNEKYQKLYKEVEAHNNSYLEEELSRYGLSSGDLTSEDIKELRAAFEDVLGETKKAIKDIKTLKLTKAQAKHIINEFLERVSKKTVGSRNKTTVKDMAGLAKAPKIASSTRASAPVKPSSKTTTKTASYSERVKNWLKF